ncbi:Uu.00g053250.m01.CDS01 [Anthostomella pinea]|uniref:Uu.00g053250.m01.CDS01 n=1 Tax=Anthostomella pinea TaxID=933095 RepID=A0AAI8VX06_9PEZI|nr:Uu.00g053250.m01.CDS01 [Anthostomella pinea]
MLQSSFRPPIIVRLLAAAGVLTVCYCLLSLQGPRWTSQVLFHFEQTPQQTTIPNKLWYKVGPRSMNDELRGYTRSCIANNPTFQLEFLTDISGDDFVKTQFASRPDLVDAFLNISIPIIKADLLRYLILYEYGSIWNDLDVSCEVPIEEWVPEQYKADASIVVGLEFDVDIWVRQFASWTIMAKPKSPHLLTVAEDCLEGLVGKAEELGVGVQDLTLEMLDDIIDVSGPRRLTRGILKSLSRMLDRPVGNDDISNVAEPKLVGDVLVLPDYAFANQMNMQFGDKVPGRVLVTHHYAGSWKNAKGGEEADGR